MKRTLSLFWMALTLSVLMACSTLPSTAPINDQVAQAIQEVTLARQAATQLLIAKKITVPQDQAVQAGLTSVRATLESAQSLSLTNPAQAAQILAAALNALAAYQGVQK